MGRDDDDRTFLVRLTGDEAIVLLDLLGRWSGDVAIGATPSPSSECFQSTAEGAALNALAARLEREVPSVFAANWQDLVDAARERLAPTWDYPTLRG